MNKDKINEYFNIKAVTTVAVSVIFIFIGLLFIRTLDIYYPVMLVSTTKSTELSVVGEGKVDVIPDTAYVDLGINVNNVSTVEEAQKTINQVNNNIVEEMTKLGIDKGDIKTSNYSIYPNYNYENNVNTISGYNGNVTVTIKVKDTKMASKIVEAGTKAGANQVQGTRFVVENPANYRQKAREKAIANAKEEAKKLADSLGIKLGKVVNIIESQPSTIGNYYRNIPMSGGIGAGGGGPDIEAGTETITSVVTLYFEKR